MTSDRKMFKVLAVSSMKMEMTTENYTVRYFFLKNINFEIKFILVFTKINHSNDTKECLKIDNLTHKSVIHREISICSGMRRLKF